MPSVILAKALISFGEALAAITELTIGSEDIGGGLLLWYQPFSRQRSDTLSIRGSGAEVDDGGEDALVGFDLDILAVTHSRDVGGVNACNLENLVPRDVQATTFGTQECSELSIS